MKLESASVFNVTLNVRVEPESLPPNQSVTCKLQIIDENGISKFFRTWNATPEPIIETHKIELEPGSYEIIGNSNHPYAIYALSVNYTAKQKESLLQLELWKDNELYETFPKKKFSQTKSLPIGDYELKIIDENNSVNEAGHGTVKLYNVKNEPEKRQGAGLRIASITTSDGINEVKKNYDYSCSYGDFGLLLEVPDFAYNARSLESCSNKHAITHYDSYISSKPIGVYNSYGGARVAYPTVNEKIKLLNSDAPDQGYTEYNFTQPEFFTNKDNYAFSVGNEFFEIKNKMISSYGFALPRPGTGRMPFHTLPAFPTQSGLLLNKSTYSAEDTLLKKEEYEYEMADFVTHPSVRYQTFPFKYADLPPFDILNVTFLAKTELTETWLRQKSVKSSLYGDDGSGPFVTEKKFFYEDPNLTLPTRTETTAGGKVTEVTVDYSGGSVNGHTGLTNENKLYVPIETETKVEGQSVSISTSTFEEFLGINNTMVYRLKARDVTKNGIQRRAVEIFDYTPLGQPKTFKKYGDIENRVVSYDSWGRIETFDYLDIHEKFEYYGNLPLLEKKLNHGDIIAEYKYDVLGRITEKSSRDGNISTAYDYNIGNGVEIISTTEFSDADNEISISRLDALGRELSTTIENFTPSGGSLQLPNPMMA